MIVLGEDPHCFLIPSTATDLYDGEEQIDVEACIQYTFTKSYPDEIPLMEVKESSNLSEKDEEDLINNLKEEVKAVSTS